MAHPLQILIIRHGEKPDTVAGVDGGPDLAPRGRARAAALAWLFPKQFITPDFIFAAQVSKDSNRSVQTITPLAAALSLNIDDRFKDDKFADLALALTGDLYAGKRVLVAWHHGKIPELAAALGVAAPPSPWPPLVFDRVWQIDYDATGAATLTDHPQQLLFGDSST